MFILRLLTAAVLIPLVLITIYFANQWVQLSILIALICISGWEWSNLVPIKSMRFKLIFIGFLLLSLGLGEYYFYYWLRASLLVWAFILYSVLSFPRSQKIWAHPATVACSCLLLSTFVCALAAINQQIQGKDLILYVFILVWATDSGAYASGKYWGKHKLIPQLSPGKTVEGFCGGFLSAAIIAVIGSFYFQYHNIGTWYVLSLVTALISMLGDLFISMLKRRSKIKDTGSIFPGHGGMLDRLDSMIAALPIFYYGLAYL